MNQNDPQDRKPPRIVACPQCKAPVPWVPENRYRPFCSERCRLIDLGAWAAGDYRVAGDETPQEDELPGGA